jgi:hypothetical protein
MNGGKTIGWYGNSALESAVFGVPTMAHLAMDAIERAFRAGYDVAENSAILNVQPSEASLYQTMRDFFDRAPSERQELAERTRAWIERHHSYKSTAGQLATVYDTL